MTVFHLCSLHISCIQVACPRLTVFDTLAVPFLYCHLQTLFLVDISVLMSHVVEMSVFSVLCITKTTWVKNWKWNNLMHRILIIIIYELFLLYWEKKFNFPVKCINQNTTSTMRNTPTLPFWNSEWDWGIKGLLKTTVFLTWCHVVWNKHIRRTYCQLRGNVKMVDSSKMPVTICLIIWHHILYNHNMRTSNIVQLHRITACTLNVLCRKSSKHLISLRL